MNDREEEVERLRIEARNLERRAQRADEPLLRPRVEQFVHLFDCKLLKPRKNEATGLWEFVATTTEAK